MRRPVLAVMTGVTGLVVGLSIRLAPHTVAAAAVVPGGVLAPAASASASTATPAPRRTASVTKVNGAAAPTRYGPVQVQITVSAGKIVAADAIAYPTQNGRDQQINSYAVPQLDSEALQAQSASIDTVSGATFTSGGYQSSLQSAIDQAHAAAVL